MFNGFESAGTWAWQISVVLVSLLRKPTVGDRAVALFSDLYRIWADIRTPYAESWVLHSAGIWDQAIAGSSAIRAALFRSFGDECNTFSGDPEWVTISGLWDFESFYDTLQISKIIPAGVEIGFPPIFLLMESLLHLGVRLLRERGAYAPPISPTISIVAGARRAVYFSRCILYKLLEHISSRYQAAEVYSWVDDVVQRIENRRKAAIEVLFRAGVEFVEGAEVLGLKLSKVTAYLGMFFIGVS